jgi:hypothetical protein
VWSGEHVDYERLKIFGCTTYYHVKDNKLDNRAKKAIFLGYATGVKGYRLWSVEDSKFVNNRDVTFDKKSMTALSKAMKPNDGDVTISNKQVIEIESEKQPDSNRGQVENPIAGKDEDEHDHEEVQQENTHVLQQQQQESLDATRPKRNYKLV